MVTADGTYCLVAGRWLHFAHHAVADYHLSSGCSILTFGQTVPVRLDGPAVWCHAVLYAYLRYGPGWQSAPMLYAIRQAATRPWPVPLQVS